MYRHGGYMRAFLFAVGFWWVSILYVFMAAVLALVPGRKGVRWAVKRYTKRMVQLMKLAGIVRRQAMTMAIADVFLLLTMLFFGIIFLLPLMRRPSAGTGGSGH